MSATSGGNPRKVFRVDSNQPWTLYTDASGVGLEACLFFGQTKAEGLVGYANG
jgi:hypothetical protein